MANQFNLSPDMQLPIPEVSGTPGPDWAELLNQCLARIDEHDHTPGFGVKITPSGIDISTDLSMDSNNLILTNSVQFVPTTSSVAATVYVSGLDLYYNDGAGNPVRITQSGGVAGTPGSIANLTPPASASYVSLDGTFVFQSNTNTAANIDVESVILRNAGANSAGLTLSPPDSMPTDYAITLPSLPVTPRVLSIDTLGDISAGSSGVIVSDDIGSQQITQVKKAIRAVPGTTAGVGEVAISPFVGTVSSASPAFVTVFTLSLDTLGNPVQVMFKGDPSASGGTAGKLGGTPTGVYAVFRDGTPFSRYEMTSNIPVPVMSLNTLDASPAAGTHIYTLQISGGGSGTANVQGAAMMVYEL